MRTALLLAFSACLGWAGTIYQVVDLGVSGSTATAYAINNSGVAAGWTTNASGTPYAFTSNGSSLQQYGPGTLAYGINSGGTAAGVSRTATTQAVVWSGGSQTSIAGAGTSAIAMNGAGDVAGVGGGQAFLLHDGVSEGLGVLPGGTWSAAYGLNAADQVTGYATDSSGTFHAFLWTSGGGMIDLGTLGGWNSYGMAIDAAGEVTGAAQTASGYLHAFLDAAGVMQDLGTLGGSSSYGYGINLSGSVVGDSTMASGGLTHAFLYNDGVLTDLNALLNPDSGWVLTAAYGINDSGQIVGTGLFDGQQRAFRLDPGADPEKDPEPGTFVLLFTGAGLLGVVQRRRGRRPPDALSSR